jgi:two-component system response regulator HupR/HoxA
MANWTTLIVFGNPNEQGGLREILEDGHQLCFESNTIGAFDFINRESVDLVLGDQEFNGKSGIDFLRDLKERYQKIIRVFSGRVDLDELACAVYDASIHEYYSKPWHPPQFIRLIQKIWHGFKLASLFSDSQSSATSSIDNQDVNSRQEKGGSNGFDKINYRNPAMSEACNLALQVAETDLPILIQGKTGTEIKLLAQAIHSKSNSRDKPIPTQNCGGLSFEPLQSELFGRKGGVFTEAVNDRLGWFPAANGAFGEYILGQSDESDSD